jgi:peptidyl-prolyl cis-trans isomerase C
MRRIGLHLLSLSCLALLASCTKAPEPKKADDVGAVEVAEGSGANHDGDSLPGLPKGPVAIVNGNEITTADFRAIYDLKLQKYSDRGREIPKTADRRYRKSIVERLIYQEILRQEAQKRGISYDKDELAQREEAQKRGIKEWDKHLRRRGESEQSLRELYIAELLERALLEADGSLEVTEAEVAEEYEKMKPQYKKEQERIRAAHILVRVGPEQPPTPGEPMPEPSEEDKKKWEAEAKAKADEIYARAIEEGVDFTQLAIEYSDGPSARKGGDLGIFTPDRMVEEFSDAAFALEAGEVSKPIKTKFGFHIIKVFGKYPPGDLPLEALDDQIRERLSARKLHQGRRDLKDKLMETYEVKNVMDDVLGPDPRAQQRRQQGHPPGARPPGAAQGARSGVEVRPPAPIAESSAAPAGEPADGEPADGDPAE